MLAQIPPTDDERDAVKDGASAVERLIERLADVPTPTGPTPRQLSQSCTFIPLADLDVCATKGWASGTTAGFVISWLEDELKAEKAIAERMVAGSHPREP